MNREIKFNRVGDKIAEIRSERAKHNLTHVLAHEQIRLADLSRDIERRSYAFAPADRNLREHARRAMTQATEIALTGGYEK
ncbi:hypothetical protein MCNF_27230 [Mycolicibacterium confluentis]|uniref:Uncharacterized protein n=1 Tax=Mycolicibacterium confluentis TaxID=28047 RepID=A0A7I7XXQ6_9MYCO|nr:hypothetical protein MCNF_27230 [Mycolicibacterium confluentis]